ncbi:MAG: DUF2975 domain-containing protein [Acidimicrobiia bacterium]|nr:DUF2975 domain-containing protein [Acidimicrobiia bacterium]
MTEESAGSRSTVLARVLEVIAIIAMVSMVLAIVATVIGYQGLNLTNGRFGDNALMTVSADLDFPVDFGDRLSWTDTALGTVDAATGKPPVELTGPISARLSIWSPTGVEQLAWVMWRIFGPALGLVGAWLIYGMTRSSRLGDPFSPANERRLWKLALLVAVGGSANLWFGQVFRSWLVERSAAAEFISSSLTFSFTPIVAGIVIGMLASVWRIGVGLREDVDGMI